MARTPLFGQLKKIFQLTAIAQTKGWSSDQLEEKLSLARLASRKIGRRNFLRNSALLAATPVACQFKNVVPDTQPESVSGEERILILGAGAAGLTAAYTLKKAGRPYKVLEATSRSGGRVFTQFNFNEQNQFIERGAELIDTNHTDTLNLAQELGLIIDDFYLIDRDVERQLLYFNGSLYTLAELSKAIAPLVKAVLYAKRHGAEVVTYHDVKRKSSAAKWDRMSAEEFLNGLKGKVEPWVLQAVGMAYLTEFGAELKDISAISLITLIGTETSPYHSMFGSSDESKRVRGGNQKLTDRLTEEVNFNGTGIEYGAKVVAIAERSGKIVVTYESNGVVKEEKAKQVIVTLPFPVLRHVVGIDKLGLSSVKMDSINNLYYGTNTKIILEFLGKQWREKGHKAPPSNGLLFTDLPSQSYWETTRHQSGTNGILTNYLGGNTGSAANRDSITNLSLVDLEKLHPGLRSKFVKGVVHNWSMIPTAQGSYSCIRPGDHLRFFGAAGEPELNGRLLFAGEHTSLENSGYINGAVETGLRVAKEALALV